MFFQSAHVTVSSSLGALSPRSPATILCDNRSAIFMSYNPISHNMSKHIALNDLFVREKVAVGHLRVQFVPFAFQIADLFTKSLSRPQVQCVTTHT